MAEPSGEYRVAFSVDLSPAFGKIVDTKTVTITQPPPDILDRRLEELKSGDTGVRLVAARDLMFFKEEGERVFPALVSLLEDPEDSVRFSALISMGNYPDHIKKNAKLFLKILDDRKESENCRGRAAYFLGRFAPLSAAVERSLEKALDSLANRAYEGNYSYALKQYRQRKKAETGVESKGP